MTTTPILTLTRRAEFDALPVGSVVLRIPETGLGWSGGIVADLDLRYDPEVTR